MKKPVKLLLVIVALAVLVCGGILGYSYYAVSASICVIRVEFNGFDNIGHLPNEYYALRDNAKLRIPGIAARLLLGNGIRDDMNFDSDTEYWNAELKYAPDGETFSDTTLEERYFNTAHGDNYRLYYLWYLHSAPDPDDAAVAMMVRAAEELHDGDPNRAIYSEKNGGIGLLDITLARKGGTNLLVISENDTQITRRILLPENDGTYTVLYEEPKHGYISYVYIKK